jgi:hypothetical protein
MSSSAPAPNVEPSNERPPADRWKIALRAAAPVVVLLALFWGVLWLLGRQFVSDVGVGLWTGAWTKQTSQWIFDPYSTSHVLHGILFFWFLWPFRGWLSLRARFLVASLIEAGWEILENSPLIIDRYRTATASLDYYGDSILNSTFDLAAAMAGFWLAYKLRWKWTLALVVAVELTMLYFVRDNLTLNVLMLFYPSPMIKEWQMAQ